MSLAKYQAKRNFHKTPEPRGKVAPMRRALHYVIQKHDASHLHYDFRLELDGTLKSWAVPKGPSLDPARKVLAVQVEDHPMDYETFEGVIPKGQYGGGTVMLWDRGTWEPLDDPHAGFKRGRLRFILHGEKLRGAWSLVRMQGNAGANGKNWLLIKSHDQYAGTGDVLKHAESVKSRRSMEEIAVQRDDVWQSDRTGPVPPDAGESAELPTSMRPQLATLADRPPAGDEWIHEIKYDGYRLLAFISGGAITLRTRTGQDWTARFEPIRRALKKVSATSALLDGEAVVLNAEGRSDFQLLQTSFKSKEEVDLHFVIFDLLHLNGRDLRGLPLLERKKLLRELLTQSGPPPRIDYSDHVQGDGAAVIKKACDLGTEGIVSKRIDAPYVSRRDASWIKSKCTKGQEFVIVGFTLSDKRRGELRSLLLGYYDAGGRLVYCGRVGTGFDAGLRRDLLARLHRLEQKKPPTAEPPPRREEATGRWVKPSLVCEVHFEGWTRDGVLRHPAFAGLRADKPAREVTREAPVQSTASAAKREKRARPTPAKPGARPAAWAGIQLTHPEKLIYPGDHLRKRDLADYYQIAAPFMLPHVVERPLALLRCPAGLAAKCFFMRNWSAALPAAVDKVKVALGRHESHVMIHDAAGLLSLVQISALEIHTWNFRAADLVHPDQVVFDLDPGPDVSWKRLVQGAKRLRELLRSIGLKPFLKTSGGKGLHLTAPIEPTVGWEEVKAFCKTIAEHLARAESLFIANMRKDLRGGKIYLDYLRNGLGSTAVAPYSSRARPGAAVSMPVDWEELTEVKSAGQFSLATAGEYLSRRKKDPWEDFAASRVDLHQALDATPKPAKE